MARIIILEGLPRTGKTTVGKAVTQTKNIAFQAEVGLTSAERQRWIQTCQGDEVSWWFIAENIRLLEKSSRRPEKLVIIDRSYLSTLSFCYAKMQHQGIGEIEQKLALIKERIIERPDLQVEFVLYFDDPPTIAFQRIRDTWNTQLTMWNSLEFLRAAYKYDKWFLDNVEKAPVVYIRDSSIDEKLNQVTDIILNLSPKVGR